MNELAYFRRLAAHDEWANRKLLTHVFLHSHYHRGQVVRMIREAGVEPPYIDFSFVNLGVLRG